MSFEMEKMQKIAQPASVYLHVPFCARKCPYCAFASRVPGAGDVERYLAALALECAYWSARHRERVPLKTLYIGGGTPSLLGEREWGRLIDTLEKNFSFEADAEVTVEANPGSLAAFHLKLWRAWRVTRVSVGVQSLDDAELRFLGRIHSAREARDALSACAAAGFRTSADLIFALPGSEDVRTFAHSIRECLAYGTTHLSLYQLSIEPGTSFANQNFPPAEGYAQYRMAQWLLPRKGFCQYEIASFAQSGFESRHNLNYWRSGDYLGLGPGAWSFADPYRTVNEPDIALYAKNLEEGKPFFTVAEDLSAFDATGRAWHAAILALRTRDGIDTQAFQKTYGVEATAALVARLRPFVPDFVAETSERLHLTPKGMRVANRIWQELL